MPFDNETFIRLAVPFFPDFSIWEGMVSNTLLDLIQMSSVFCGLAATSFAIDVWTSYRLNAGGRKNDL